MTDEQSTVPATDAGREIILNQIYLKDCSYEAPNGPRIPTQEWNPKINVNMNTTANDLGNHLREVVLTVTVEAKIGEATAFLVEVKQAGVFTLRNLAQDDLRRTVSSLCPEILFPYVRAEVGNLIQKGGFPQFLLPPVSFDALYTQSLKAQSEQPAGSAVN
ncbi:MAG TPA: protein-export chaperone SecB [Steroidobacteraceae bacterium]|nr:protein-export chaperone SecB [Steroidobacteraceae bacterium]